METNILFISLPEEQHEDAAKSLWGSDQLILEK
jgi:hypothetical protein